MKKSHLIVMALLLLATFTMTGMYVSTLEVDLVPDFERLESVAPDVSSVNAPSPLLIFSTQGILKIMDVFTGGIIYLIFLWILSGNHKVGRMLFRYADEVALDEENARNPDPNIHLYARSNLAIVNGARIIGFAIVCGSILAF